MQATEKKYAERKYKVNEVVWFRKTKEAYGGLSNMCSGYSLKINGHDILSSEALYQACRFPDFPDIQKLIISEKSPMTAKMKSKPHRTNTREDWDNVRIIIMRWVLQVKLAQNFIKFGKLLEETYPKQIVEDSRRDRFWGAVRDKNDTNSIVGVNALGRLLMELRSKYMSENRYDLLVVSPPQLTNFKLFGSPIEPVDERINFVNNLMINWGLNYHYSVSTDNKKEITPTNIIHKSQTENSNNDELVKDRIMLILGYGKELSSRDLIKRVRIEWTAIQMTNYLKKLDNVQVIKGSPLKFKIKDTKSSIKSEAVLFV